MKRVGEQLAIEEGLTTSDGLPGPVGVALVRREAPIRGVRPAMVVELEHVDAEGLDVQERHEHGSVEALQLLHGANDGLRLSVRPRVRNVW